METTKMVNKNESYDVETIQQLMANEFASKLINAKNLGKEFLSLFEIVKAEQDTKIEL